MVTDGKFPNEIPFFLPIIRSSNWRQTSFTNQKYPESTISLGAEDTILL